MSWLRTHAHCPWSARVGLLALGLVAGCVGSASPAPATEEVRKTVNVATALIERLPELAELGPELERGQALLGQTEAVLTREPPPRPDLSPYDRGDEAQTRLHKRIEVYFERGLRFEESQRIAGIELMGALAQAAEAQPAEVMPSLLSGLLLSDLAALGYDSAGGSYLPGALTDLSEMPVAMAHARVAYSALAADAFGLCAMRAEAAGHIQVQALCEARALRMRLHAQRLPECTDPSVFAGKPSFPQAAPAPSKAGLILLGTYGAPLLRSELTQVIEGVHGQLATRIDLPLLPLLETTEPQVQGGACAAARLPSDALFSAHPDTRWYGLSLQCQTDGHDCVLSVCGDGEAGCLQANVEQGADPKAWLKAARRLEKSAQGLLLESSGDVVNPLEVSVSVSDVRSFGSWSEAAPPTRQLMAQETAILACQADERYAGTWTLQVDSSGSVASASGASERATYPLDEAFVAGEQNACIARVLGGLAFGRARSAAGRRLMFQLEIPARIQVDVPFSLRKDAALGALSTPSRLGQDGFALSLARCAALAEPAPASLGICLAVAPDGHISGLSLDTEPGRVARPLAPAQERPAEPKLAAAQVEQCLRDALGRFDWGCRDGGPDGHAALTFFLPRGLVDRF